MNSRTRATVIGAIVLRYAGSTITTMSRTQGCVSLCSAEAECYAMVSALAEPTQVQEIFGEYHEDTHFTLGTDSSAVKANVERLGCDRMQHSSIIKHRYLQDASTNQEVWLRKVGTKNNVADGLTKSVSQQVLQNMLTALKIERTEPRHENVPIDMITARSVQQEPMDAQRKSPPGARGVNPSAWHKNFVTGHSGSSTS